MGAAAQSDPKPYAEFRIVCAGGCHAYKKGKAYTAAQIEKAMAKATMAADKANMSMYTEPSRMKLECFPYMIERRDISGWHEIPWTL